MSQLKRAVTIRASLDRLQKQLNRLTGAQPAGVTDGVPRRMKHRRISAAARARISAAAKARWAKFRARKGRN
jgi:hypothetical protein